MLEKKQGITELLNGDTSVLLTANGALSRLWLLMLFELGCKTTRWDKALNDYCHEHSVQSGHVDKSLKGNIQKRLSNPDMPWQTFAIGISILPFSERILTIKVKDQGKESVTQINIPRVFTQDVRGMVPLLWAEITNEWPDRMENWKPYLDSYCEWLTKQQARRHDPDLKGNLSRTIGADNVTWATLFKGLAIMNVDELEMSLELRHEFLGTKTITVKLPNGAKREIDV